MPQRARRQANRVRVFLELGDTPLGVSNTDYATIAGASGAFVDAVYSALPGLAGTIAAWEIGNEPNEINIGLYQNQPEAFADYVASVAAAVKPLEAKFGVDIPVVTGAIAYNDFGYMTAMFQRLGFNPNIDGFGIHPYTFAPDQSQVDGPPDSPFVRSRRPTDWTDQFATQDENDFQGALYNLQGLMNQYGYQDAGLWITEVGVPSWNGLSQCWT